jgi:hypothetical protein
MKYNKSCKLSGATGFMTVRGHRTRKHYETVRFLQKKRLKCAQNITHFISEDKSLRCLYI